MASEAYDALKLENQLCFPLYAASREVVKHYRPFLAPLGITYTQYIVLLVLWETGVTSVRDLGVRLYLDSGTLTPVLKTLEKNGLITRRRSEVDERVLLVDVTPAGRELQEKAADIPQAIREASNLTAEDAAALIALTNQILASSGDE
jgi:DNA-binding MarR family transcriptional regulator